eukprot:scaffold8138_cov108-Isochrysis_galbana.AAC.3
MLNKNTNNVIKINTLQHLFSNAGVRRGATAHAGASPPRRPYSTSPTCMLACLLPALHALRSWLTLTPASRPAERCTFARSPTMRALPQSTTTQNTKLLGHIRAA